MLSNLLAVFRSACLNLVRDVLLGRVGDEALAAPEHLHGVPHVAVVDRDLQLTLARLRRVH